MGRKGSPLHYNSESRRKEFAAYEGGVVTASDMIYNRRQHLTKTLDEICKDTEKASSPYGWSKPQVPIAIDIDVKTVQAPTVQLLCTLLREFDLHPENRQRGRSSGDDSQESLL